MALKQNHKDIMEFLLENDPVKNYSTLNLRKLLRMAKENFNVIYD